MESSPCWAADDAGAQILLRARHGADRQTQTKRCLPTEGLAPASALERLRGGMQADLNVCP